MSSVDGKGQPALRHFGIFLFSVIDAVWGFLSAGVINCEMGDIRLMKRIASCILTLSLLLTLSACNGKSDSAGSSTLDTSVGISGITTDTTAFDDAESINADNKNEDATISTDGKKETTNIGNIKRNTTSVRNTIFSNNETTSSVTRICKHPDTEVRNMRDATASEKGYTGDTYCKDCGLLISRGLIIPKSTATTTAKVCNHRNTEIRNRKDASPFAEGYTGDTYCNDCGGLVSSGSSIPKRKSSQEVERQIFDEVNAERVKGGLNALVWDEELYAGTKVRVKEYYDWCNGYHSAGAHKRPNGDKFVTAIYENSNYTDGDFRLCGENCAAVPDGDMFVPVWMDSTGHRENILRSSFSRTAIAVIYTDDGFYLAAQFFCMPK